MAPFTKIYYKDIFICPNTKCLSLSFSLFLSLYIYMRNSASMSEVRNNIKYEMSIVTGGNFPVVKNTIIHYKDTWPCKSGICNDRWRLMYE